VDAIAPGRDDAPAFVLLHGEGHGADANCDVGWDWCRACLPIAARCYRDSRWPVRRDASDDRAKLTSSTGTSMTARPAARCEPLNSYPRIAQVGPQAPPAPSAPLRAKRAPLRGRVPPVDYLDNPLPPSIAADRTAFAPPTSITSSPLA
jgi:hypothetical protein